MIRSLTFKANKESEISSIIESEANKFIAINDCTMLAPQILPVTGAHQIILTFDCKEQKKEDLQERFKNDPRQKAKKQ